MKRERAMRTSPSASTKKAGEMIKRREEPRTAPRPKEAVAACRDDCRYRGFCALVVGGKPAAAPSPAMNSRRLDHLVGGGQKCFRYGKAERLGGLSFDDEIEPGRLLDRNVGRPQAEQNLIDNLSAFGFIPSHGVPAANVGSAPLREWQDLP
jgi:hypothetical protein